MIYDKTLGDRTQKILLRELQTTEKLISKVATKLSTTQKTCNIYAMTDLGIAHNVTRMRGGFFTGAVYNWEEPDIPFVPVDSTVNVCGTALYKINSDIHIEEFKERCESVLLDTSKYKWNFMNGNHFISLCYAKRDYDYVRMKKGYYMLVHASACEYKEKLYPTIGNWYYNSIQTENLGEHRYLRYIEGEKAEKFYKMANMLETFNAERNYFFCESVLHSKMGEEILNVSHYGMPSMNEILIGVQKTDGFATLLTSLGKNVYIVSNKRKEIESYIPHGFGLELPEKSDIAYYKEGIKIGEKDFSSGSITIGEDAINRHGFSEEKYKLREYVKKIAEINNLKICAELKQVCSFSAKGFQIWRSL